jgi:hypothetical protein
MLRGLALGLCLILVIGVFGCGQKEAEETPAKAPAKAPEVITAAGLWKMIGQDKPYTDYAFWPGVEGIMDGKSPHGALIRTFVNDGALSPGADAYPYGSVIIKENYMPDSTLAKLTVMYKVKDYNPEGGDWFWAVYGPDGTAEMEGKIQSCIGCHAARATDDYVFLFSLPKEETEPAGE